MGEWLSEDLRLDRMSEQLTADGIDDATPLREVAEMYFGKFQTLVDRANRLPGTGKRLAFSRRTDGSTLEIRDSQRHACCRLAAEGSVGGCDR